MTLDERRTEAYKQLKVTTEEVATSPIITKNLRRIFIQVRKRKATEHVPQSPYEYLRASDSLLARAVLDLYYSLPKNLRNLPSLEAYCVAAKVPALRIEQIIVETVKRLGKQASQVIAAVNQPRVMDKTVEAAMKPDGTAERMLIHRISEIIPQAGPHTKISVNTQANATAQAANISVPAPPPERTIRRLVDRFNEARSLAPQPAELPEAESENVIPMPSREEFEEVEE